eukprot:2363600-Rhodomonas_salina.1
MSGSKQKEGEEGRRGGKERRDGEEESGGVQEDTEHDHLTSDRIISLRHRTESSHLKHLTCSP